MTRLIYRMLNAPAIILMTILGVAVQTSLFNFWYFEYLQPDVVLIAVIWCGLRRSFAEGGILTLILANVAELHSSSPQGTFLIIYMAIYLLVRLAAHVLVLQDVSAWLIVTVSSAVFLKFGEMVMLWLLGAAHIPWEHILVVMFPGALATALVASWAFKGLERFDWVTFKNARSEQALEDELQLDAPGSRI